MSYFDVKWLDKYSLKADVILDVGSYDGKDGLIFKNIYPNARVISIEAELNNYNRMIKNPKIKSLEIYNYAVCDIDGEITFYPNKGTRHGCGSIHEPAEAIYRFEGMAFDNPQILPSIRLDSFCKKHNIEKIDLIHMDIQGTEHEALIGLGVFRPTMMFLEMGGCSLECYKGTTDPTNKLLEMDYELLEKLPGDQLWRYKHAIKQRNT